MPGWLLQVATSARLSGWSSGNAPMIANRPDEVCTAANAIAVAPGSQPGRWMTAASTRPIHQADGLLSGKRRDLTMRQIARKAAAPDVDLGINDLHRVLSSRYVPPTS
jgi:hypothetical protein